MFTLYFAIFILETIIITIARIFVSFSIILTYPLQCNPCRNCLTTLVRFCYNGGEAFSDPVEKWLSRGLTLGILIGSFTIASITNNLGVVFALIGATGSSIVSYILPGGFYYIITNPALTSATDEGTGTVDGTSPAPWKRKVALAQLVIGIMIIPICISVILEHYFYA